MLAPDGKMRQADVADTEQILGLYNIYHHRKQSHLSYGLRK